jgi:hypothetical protein
MSEDLDPELQIIQRESAFFDAHQDELRLRYPDQYVAILHGMVIDSDPSLSHLAERVYREIGYQTILMRHTQQGQPTIRVGGARLR